MTFTYTFANAEETVIQYEDGEGYFKVIPVDPENRHYVKFLESGAEAAAYVAPPVVPYVDPLEARIAALEASVAALKGGS